MSEPTEDTPVRSFTMLGRKWVLQIDRYVRRDVRAETDNRVDLFDAFDVKLYQQLADPETLVDVLWAICRPHAGEIKPEEFGRAFRGDTIEQAALALEGAITDFFPSRQRLMLTKAMAKGAEKISLVEKVLNKALDAEDPETTSMLKFLSTPASPASTPADLPSEN